MSRDKLCNNCQWQPKFVGGRKRTVFVRVLKTSIEPEDVPMKICFPEGLKRAVVGADLYFCVHQLRSR